MKYLATLLLILGFGLSGFGQTIKSLGYNTTNGQVIANTGTNGMTFTNANITFNNISLGGDGNNGTITSPASSAVIDFVNCELYGGWGFTDTNGVSFAGPLLFSGVTNAAVTRANLGLGATWLTNTNVANVRTALGITALVNALSQPRNAWDVNSLLYNGTTAPTNGASIENWYTSVMHNQERTFTQSTATNRPTLQTNIQNGMAGLLFDGAGDAMNTVGWNSLFNRAGSTIFVVCRPTAQATNGSGTTWQRPQLIADNGGFIGINVNPASGTSNFITAWGYDDNGAQSASSAAIATNTTVLVTMRYGSGIMRLQINTNAAVTNAFRNYSSVITGATHIGRGNEANTTYTGYIFEVVTIGRAITDDELSAYQSALMTKWGL